MQKKDKHKAVIGHFTDMFLDFCAVCLSRVRTKPAG